MVKGLLTATALIVLCGGSPALAAVHHHHRHHGWHHRHQHHRHHVYRHAHRGPFTIGYGDKIISGRTGLHRSMDNVMVPDSAGPNDVLSGRRRGSGLGANGLPGSNLDE